METKKVLDQWEIDALLSSIGGPADGQGAVAEATRNVKPYDFRRPDKFSKDHIRSLQVLHENYARIASSTLSSYLRINVNVHLSSVEQATQDEYLQQLPAPAVIGLASVGPMPGHIILEVNTGPAYAIIDRLLGGQGRAFYRARETTDIELSMLEALMRSLLSSMKEAWSGVVDLEPKLDELVLSPQLVQAAVGEVVILLLFEIQVGDSVGTISMCLPYTALEPIIGRLGSQIWFSSPRKDALKSEGKDLLRQVERVPLPLVVQLGSSTVSIGDLMGLQEGNVILLDTGVNAELPVLFGGVAKFLGRPGRVGKKLALQVSQVLIEDEIDLRERPQVVPV